MPTTEVGVRLDDDDSMQTLATKHLTRFEGPDSRGMPRCNIVPREASPERRDKATGKALTSFDESLDGRCFARGKIPRACIFIFPS